MTDSIPTSVVTTATNTTTTTLPTAVTPTTATTDTDSTTTTTAVVTVSNDRKKVLPLPLTDISKPNNNNNNSSSSSKTRHCTSLPLFYNAENSELCTLGARPGMECMPLRAPPGPYHHYHVSTDQTKSLQELQNEVGALLEFRDLVIETFPDLKHKMASMSQTNTLTGMASASSLASRREWEPGIRVKRKLAQKENTDMSSSSLIRSRSNSHSGKKEPKSGEGNGSVVQDSGFSTETSSSKEAHSASSTTGAMQGNAASNRLTIDADDELLNLLDVIHRKSNRLREEVEQLQNIERDKFRKNVTHSNSSDNSCLHKTFQDHVDRLTKEDIQVLRKERDRLLDKLAEMEAETLAGRIKATKMHDQVEELSTVKKELEDQLKVALSQKLELNSRLHELHTKYGVRNSSSSSESTTSRFSVATTIPVVSGNAITPTHHFSQQQLIQGASGNQLTNNSHFPVLSSSSSSTITATSTSATASNTTYSPVIGQNRVLNDSKNIYTFPGDNTKQIKNNINNLGHLDGLVSSPNRSTKVRATDTKKIAAILLETNVLELQRHLLTLTIQNQALKERLDQETKSNIFLMKKIDKSKEDIEDMRFQLEEKDIELEGTKAQLRVLESKTPSRLDFNVETNRSSSTIILTSRDSPLIQTQISTPSMKAMVPLAMEEIQQHSSSTESAQDQTERDSRTCLETPKRRPSKIPLPGSGTKSYLAPKPPTGRSPGSQKSPSGPVSNKSLSKSTGSLYGKSGPPSIKRLDVQTPCYLNRPESAQSIRKDNSLGTNSRSSSSSIPISSKSTPSPHKISSSPLPKPKRDSLTSRVRHLDSLSRVQNVTSTSSSNINTNNNSTIQVTTSSVNNSQKQLINNSNTKKDLSSSFTQGQIRDRKQGTVSVRRVSSASVGRGTGVDVQQNESDSGKIKTIRNKEIEKQFMSSSSAGKDLATNGKVIKTTKSTPNSTLTPSSSNPTSPTKRNYVAKPQIFSNIQPLTILYSTNNQPKSHGLIGEYLAKTCPPPPILKPSFTPSSPRSPDLLKMAYTHPQLLLFDMEIEDDTELDSRNNVIYEKNNEIEYVEDSRDQVQSPKYSKQDESNRTMTKRRAIYIESNFNIYNQNLSDDRNENKCKLVGKVNPKIAKTWEQLNAVGIRETAPRTFLRSISNNSDESDKLILCQPQESKSNFRVNKVIYSEESSDEFYDSIDGVQDDENNLNDHIGNIVSISHEDAGEEMAEINSFDHYNRNYWSIDSSELV